MRKLSIEEYDLLYELVETYCFNLVNPAIVEKARLEISKLLNCEPKEAIELIDKNYPKIYQQITKPIKEDLEKTYKGLYFSEIHDH